VGNGYDGTPSQGADAEEDLPHILKYIGKNMTSCQAWLEHGDLEAGLMAELRTQKGEIQRWL
jgi:hypothetical protein